MTPLTASDVRAFLLHHFSYTIAANSLDPADLGDDFDLLKAGVVDSLGVIEMISAVEQHFNITVDFEAMDPEELTLLGQFSHFVAQNATENAPDTMNEESPIFFSDLQSPSSSLYQPSDAECAHFEACIAQTLPWVQEASNPYWDWLWGSPIESMVQLKNWLGRANSELSVQHVVCLGEGDRIVGGFIALPGSEVQVCRKADLLALLNYLRNNPREPMITRMRQARSLFAGAAKTEFYLSRMGVVSSARGRGVGRRLVEMFLQEGRNRGFNQFRLDVSADNEPAIRLYRAAGFTIASDSAIAGTPIRYFSMVMSP